MNSVIATAKEKMSKSISSLKSNFETIRAGRANAAVLDKIRVDYYGVPTAIKEMAAISVPEARILQIQPWDATTLHAIEKAIQTSEIGINPQNDGRIIRLVFPQLTEEKRKELAKEVRKTGEDGKIAIRSIRGDARDKIKKMAKNSEITEDDQKSGEKKLQDVTDEFVKKIDELTAAKEKEIMEI